MISDEAKKVLDLAQGYDVALISIWDDTLSVEENQIRMGGLLRNLWFLVKSNSCRFYFIACLGKDVKPQTSEDKYLICTPYNDSDEFFRYLWDLFSSSGISFLYKSKFSDNFYSVGTNSQAEDYKRQTKVGDINQVLLPLVERGVHVYTDGSKQSRVNFINNSVFSPEEKTYCSQFPRPKRFYFDEDDFPSGELFADLRKSVANARVQPIIEHVERLEDARQRSQEASQQQEEEQRLEEIQRYPKRVMRWCRKYDTAIISAWRTKLEDVNDPDKTLLKTEWSIGENKTLPIGYTFTDEENEDRRRKLDVLLRVNRYLVVYLGHDKLSPANEEKYLVINRLYETDFFNRLFALSEWFNQDHFLYKIREDTCFYALGTNTSSNPGYNKRIEWGDVTQLLPHFAGEEVKIVNPNPEAYIPHPSLLNGAEYAEYVSATDRGKLKGYRI